MYVNPNFKSRKELKFALDNGFEVRIFSPGPFPATDGINFVEGPHYPEPHRWYAQVLVKNGFVVKLIK